MEHDHLGPVEYLVVKFSEPACLRDGFDRLLARVRGGLIRILDLEFVTNNGGVVRTLAASDAAAEFADFDGASSGLLDDGDLETLAADLPVGSSAAVLVYEDLSLLRVIDAWESAGAQIVAEGPVDVDDLEAALPEVAR